MHESETNCYYWVPIDGELLVVQDEAASYYFGSVANYVDCDIVMIICVCECEPTRDERC